MQVLCTVFQCMTWPDSTVCHKATRLATAFIREVCDYNVQVPGSSCVVDIMLLNCRFCDCVL